MMPTLSANSDGVLLPVQAQPKAKKNAITGVHDGRLKVAVTQAPERGKANAAILKLLAQEFGLKRSQIELVTGKTSAKKAFRIKEVDAATLEATISERWGR